MACTGAWCASGRVEAQSTGPDLHFGCPDQAISTVLRAQGEFEILYTAALFSHAQLACINIDTSIFGVALVPGGWQKT